MSKVVDINKIDDKTIFIIGSGPSLNKVDVSKLSKHKTISLNRQYIAYEDWGFIPTYYLVIDKKLVKTISEDISGLLKNHKEIQKVIILSDESEWVKDMSETYGDRFVPAAHLKKGVIIRDNPAVESIQSTGLAFVGNAGACAVHAAHLLGYEKIILIGIDATYAPREESIKANRDLSHFHEKYFDIDVFEEGVNQGKDGEYSGMRCWRGISKLQKKHDNFNVYSSTLNSPINEVFEYVEFEEWFK